MSDWAVPGAKCICVDDVDCPPDGHLRMGTVYTVRDLTSGCGWFHGKFCGGLELRLVESPRRLDGGGYHIARFLPLTEHPDTTETVAELRRAMLRAVEKERV